MQDSPAAQKFVDTLIERKNIQGVDEDVLLQLKSDLLKSLERQVNRALIESLNQDQLAKFEHLIDTHQNAKLQEFLIHQGVDVQAVVARVMMAFQNAYIGDQD